MKNLTLRVEENTLKKVRKIANEQSTSVNALIRGYLDQLVRRQEIESKARAELLLLCEESNAKMGNQTWKRKDLYVR